MSDPDVTPTPTDEEAAAIAAALAIVLASGGEEADEVPAPDPRWRFSGRWWARPTPVVRQRPWRF